MLGLEIRVVLSCPKINWTNSINEISGNKTLWRNSNTVRWESASTFNSFKRDFYMIGKILDIGFIVKFLLHSEICTSLKTALKVKMIIYILLSNCSICIGKKIQIPDSTQVKTCSTHQNHNYFYQVSTHTELRTHIFLPVSIFVNAHSTDTKP